jgi:uncharacterized SAM-binding protein YcdF (DUF218 family)
MLAIFIGILAAVCALFLRSGSRPGPRLFAGGCLVIVWLSAMPVVAHSLLRALGTTTPASPTAVRAADAIVILGGGLRSRPLEYPAPTVNTLTLHRVRYGAALAKATSLPVLVTGGLVKTARQTEARVMAAVLREEYGVAVRWIEDSARNTRENAEASAGLLAPEGMRTVVVVAHAFDMPRAAREFRAVGFDVVEAPTIVDTPIDYEWGDFVPSIQALTISHYLVYEILATVRNWFRAPAAVPRWPDAPVRVG